jgi:hypothetical protein
MTSAARRGLSQAEGGKESANSGENDEWAHGDRSVDYRSLYPEADEATRPTNAQKPVGAD